MNRRDFFTTSAIAALGCLVPVKLRRLRARPDIYTFRKDGTCELTFKRLGSLMPIGDLNLYANLIGRANLGEFVGFKAERALLTQISWNPKELEIKLLLSNLPWTMPCGGVRGLPPIYTAADLSIFEQLLI